MSKTLWSIFWSTLYITYLGVFFPYLFLYLIISSSGKLSRNKIIIRRELKKKGIPREMRRKIAKSYGYSLSLRNMLQFSNIQKPHKIGNKFIKIFQ